MLECPLCSCQFVVGYHHVDLSFIVCLECFSTIRQLNHHKNYARFSLLTHQIDQSAQIANRRLNTFKKQQHSSLDQLLKSKAIEKCFFIKEYSQNSGKLSLSTNQDPEIGKEIPTDSKKSEKKNLTAQRYSEVVNDLIDKIQPTKEIFLKKAEGLLQSAASVKQKCKMFGSQCKALAAEIPNLKNIKKGLNGFFKFF